MTKDLPITLNLSVIRGRDFHQGFRLKGPDGVPLDLTGSQIRSQIRQRPNLSAVLIVEFAITRNDPAGEFALQLTATQTSAIGDAAGGYDVMIEDAGGRKTTYVKGSVTFQDSVTQVT